MRERPGTWWDGIFDRPGELWAAGVARVLTGPVVVLHLWDFLEPALRGQTYQDRFHLPYSSWLPHLPEPAYAAALTVGAGAGIAMLAGGRWARAAAAMAFVVVTYNLLLDQTAFRHNRAFLAVVLGGLALTGGTGAVTPGTMAGRRAAGASRPLRTLWPLWLLRTLVASVYLASGASKLLDAAWRNGDVLHDRVVRYQHHIDGLPFDAVLVDVLTSPTFHMWLAPVAIATELFIGAGLWFRSTRLAAVWVAVAFHAAIEVSASVQVFSVAAVAALAIWATPSTCDRVVQVPPGSWWARWVPRLDWLARFRVEPSADGGLVLTDRDGAVHRGGPAAVRVLTRLPLTFWFSAPLLALPAIRRRAPDAAAVGG